ncbi:MULTISPECIES: holo-ACP synthase [unclassified Pyramidobacter]|uniref:holo-ACP synthase n=1 Tax=unclassified Pyramidobacter TaxID=2632171 RepID=UPI000EA3159E|nr:holo-ACP synthase [Pyramidobacter sp. CG50-2]RKJ81503.1 holo-[acyl-carrier-protein] synthase [Pyramidobacter sp. CG50-2]
MIAGVGMDLCGVERMREACESEAFCRRVFTEAELSYAAGKKSRACHLAVAYAAKEAFAKATGLGLAKLGLHSVSVRHDAEGRPFLVLDPQTPALEPYRRARFHLSLSHDGGIAAAVVIYETEGV